MKKAANKILMFAAALMAALLITAAAGPKEASAASFTSRKTAISKTSSYSNSYVCMKWSRISGAVKYEVYRAKVNPKTGKTGAWKKWKTTKKLSLKVKASGDYKYRVRGIKKNKKSKWSSAKRVFAANARITKMGYTAPDIFFGVRLHSAKLELRVLVTNKTSSPMGFVPSGTRFGNQATLYALNKTTGKKMKSWEADLDTGTFSGIAKLVEAKKSQSVYYYCFLDDDDWDKYKNCKFMMSISFYPNPEVEDISTQMALACTKSAADSSLAVK